MGAGPVDDDLGDVYELLGIDEDAGEKEVQAAYRKGSLKCHPDRNPDDPDAAQKFDRLTRAKDFLLDPVRRGELDRHRKAKRELQERYAQEDDKRRKLREDLESREGAAAARSAQAAREAEAARRRYVQMDFSSRLRAREAELAERHVEVACEAAEARSIAAEARVKVTWRKEAPAPRVEDIRKALSAFSVKAIEIGESAAVVQLDTREDALRAVLRCREIRHQLPFRVSLLSAKNAGLEAPAPAPEAADESAKAPAKAPSAPAEFQQWESSTLDDLWELAAAQRAKAAS